MDLRTAATELYGVAPSDFMPTRTRLAKEARAAGDKDLATAIGGLPKPTLSAWAVNLLVRTSADDVEELLALGTRLREAQAAGSGQDVRELGRTQHTLLAASRRQAEEVAREAGQRLSQLMGQRVQGTLHAAMADPWAAEAVRSGVLVRDLESTGFGVVDLSGAIAVPDVAQAGPSSSSSDDATILVRPERRPSRPSTSTTAAPAGRERRRDDQAHRRDEEARRRAEESAAEAEAAADAARTRLADAEHAVEHVEREIEDRDAEIAALTARLRDLRAEQVSAGLRQRHAASAQQRAAEDVRAAEKAAARARAAVPDPPD